MRVPKPIHQYPETSKDFMDNVHKALSGNLTLSENVRGAALSGIITNATANTEFAVEHNLGVIPTGYIVTKKSAAGDIYTGSTAWTTTQIYLKCSTAAITIDLQILA